MSKIEQRVMGSVAVIYTARQFVSALAIKLYVLLTGLIALVQLTWVHKIFANWAQVGLGGSFNFLTYAILHTHPAVQFTLIVLVVTGVSLAYDLMRPARTLRLA
jgi:hypothetical protein